MHAQNANEIPLNFTKWLYLCPAEIGVLILVLYNGMAPSEGMIPTEVFTIDNNQWSPIFANLFSYINCTGNLPPGWRTSIIVPLFKKGNPSDPHNCRLISLLDAASKYYAGTVFCEQAP